MNRASVRITESLDLESVRPGVVDGACSLTGARHGGVTVIDEEGQLQAFVTSGLTPEEHALVVALPGGLSFFEHMIALPEPLRVADFSALRQRVAACPRSRRRWDRWEPS